MNILRSYLYLFTRYRLQYALGLCTLLLTNAVYMSIPRVLGAAVDAFDQGAGSTTVLRYGLIVVGLAVLQAVARVASRIYVLGVSRRVEYDLKGIVHDHLVRLAPSFYSALSTGDLMSRMTNDVTLVRALGGPAVLYFANAILMYVLGVAYMITLSWQLTAVVLAPLPLMAWVVRGMVHRVRAYALASREALSDLNTVVQENLAGAQVVRSFALEQAQERRFAARSDVYVDWALKESWTRAWMIPLVGMAGGLSYVGVLGVGGPLAAAGTVSLGDLVAFVSYVAMLVFPTVALGWILSLVQRAAAALERLDRVLRAPLTITAPSPPRALPEPGGAVTVRGLDFRYGDALAAYREQMPAGDGLEAEARRPALCGIDLEVRPGELVALVGRVGSGKSTLLKALVRLVEIPSGAVFFDGVDVTEVSLHQLRERVAYVPQDDFLFSASVAQNVAFGVPEAAQAQVRLALEIAGLDPEHGGLAAGLQTAVGERGLNLSGGQRQRVALARALLRNAPLLALDNALSNVDTETERRILARLTATRAGRTVIVTSNRITAVQDADRIYVMDGGRVIDAGTHDELIARPGLYASMHEQQRLSAQLERY